MTTVAVAIIARDEAEVLPGCLALLDWADETVVLVDDRSRDRTAEVASEAGATVVVEQWRGFAGQRDRLAELVSSDWIFYIDADERVSSELANEVLSTVAHSGHAAYSVPRCNVLLGQPMRAGGWWPDPHLRLIRRSMLQRWNGVIHETPDLVGSSGSLVHPIIHLGHRDLAAMLSKTAKWAPLEGERLLHQINDRPIHTRTMLAAIGRDLLWRLIRRQGWRDGTAGWIEILYQAFSRFITVAYAWEHQRPEPLSRTYQRFDQHLASGGSLSDFPGFR